MKIFDIREGRTHHHYLEYSSIEETVGRYSPDIVFVEAPDWVYEGYGYDPTKTGDERFIRPELPEGWEYDEQGNPWDPERFRSAERKELHAETTDDTMMALRMIRNGDTSRDWNGWLDRLDAYNTAISDTVDQPGYPHDVVYPDYPTKPWEE